MVLDKIKKAGRMAKDIGTANVGDIAGQTIGKTKVGRGIADWASYFGLRQALTAIDDPGFILFLGGIFMHFIGSFLFNITGNAYSTSTGLRIVLSLLFLFYAILFVFKGKGLIFTILFLVWYWVFDLSINYGFFLIAAVAIIFYAIFFKLESIKGEFIGILPVLVFYLDIGLISFITVRFDLTLTSLLTNLILYTPWWGLFGLFFTKKDNTFIQISKFAGFGYLFIVLLLGSVPNIGYEQAVPGFEEVVESQKEVEQQISKPISGFRATYYKTTCTIRNPANPKKIDECERIKTAEYKCKEFEGDEERYKECYNEIVNVERVDTSKELPATKFIFERPKAAYREKIQRADSSIINIPYDIKYLSPEKVNVVLSCQFENGEDIFLGKVEPFDTSVLDTGSETETKSKRISCESLTPLPIEENYQVIFKARLKGVESEYYTDKIFIEKDMDTQRIRELIRNIQRSETGEELAVFYLNVGTEERYVIGEENPNIRMDGFVRNLEEGKIKNVEEARIEIDDSRIDPRDCLNNNFNLEKSNVLFWQGGGLPEIGCNLEIKEELRKLGSQYQNPEYVPVEFRTKMIYDYEIEEKDDFEIAGVEI